MTIDERLDKLVERHEALAQSVEIIAANLNSLTVQVNTLTADVQVQRRTMDDLMLGFSTLTQLARRHEERLDRLEGR
jgi:uncharacterized protein YoxC